MWTLTDSLIILISLALHAVLFFIGMRLKHTKTWQKWGDKVLENKEKQLHKNLILRFFVWNVDGGRTLIATGIIASLIFLKNLGMLIGGIVFVGLLMVPVQGILMSVITKEMIAKGMDGKALRKTQNLQLSGMLLLNALGNFIGYHYTWHELSLLEVARQYGYGIIVLLVLGLVLSVLAAANEVKFFKVHRSFLG